MLHPYTPLAVANTFIEKFGASGGIEHMKLQKLVYCAYGWWLAVNEPGNVLTSEGPEMWKHGPVFDSLYRSLKVFGSRAITQPKSNRPDAAAPIVDPDDEHTRSFIDWVWGRYGHLSGFALSDMTHKEGTPWSRVAKENGYRVPRNMEIPDDYIREEFTQLLEGLNGRRRLE